MTEEKYIAIMRSVLEVCKNYRPKLGHGRKEGYSLTEFKQLYGEDPFYSWMGLDSDLMYAAHKAAGGMTSVYRQIGIGCERIFREVIKDNLNLSEEDASWSYTVPKPHGKTRTLYLDGRIPLEAVQNKVRQKLVHDWIVESARRLDVDGAIVRSLQGVVFEVRQGYKSKDSKRQNADIANAAAAYTKRYLPCVSILSKQIDQDIALRYTAEKWHLLTGLLSEDQHISVYGFMKNVVGYDLAAFFSGNSETFKVLVREVLEHLLSAE